MQSNWLRALGRRPYRGLSLLFIFSVLINLPFVWFAWGNPTSDKDSGLHGPARLHQRLQSNIKKLEVFDFREKGLLEELGRLEKEVNTKKKEIRELEKAISSLNNESLGLNRTLKRLERERKRLEENIAQRLVFLYKYARRGYMRALCTASDLDEFRRRLKYLGCIMEEDRRHLEDVFTNQYELQKRCEEIKERIKWTDGKREKEKTNLVQLKEQLEKQVIHLMRIHEEKEFYETAVKELEAVGPRFKETIVKVETQPRESPLLFKNIEEVKGKLPIPINGTVIRGSKLFRSKKVHLERGIFIRAKEGDQVRAVLPGRVEFSGQLKGYGQVIIINHGSHLFTISALLSRRKKDEGDTVKAGEVIGEVGGNATAIGPSVYFEIRKGGKNVDPLRWLRIPRSS